MAVEQYGLALQYASKALKNDKEIIGIAVKQARWGLFKKYVSHKINELKNDKVIIGIAVKQNGLALRDADELKNDKEIVDIAVKQNGLALQYASNELKNDREIVDIAVRQNGLLLKYASEDLKNDREIVDIAIKQNGLALQYASNELKADREIVSIAARQNGLLLKYASEDLKNDRKIVGIAVKQNGLALQYASNELKDDRKIVGIAVKQNGLALQYASNELKDDRKIVGIAVKQNGLAIQYASEDLKNGREIVDIAIKQNGLALQYASEALKHDKDVLLVAIEGMRWIGLKRNNSILANIKNLANEDIIFIKEVLKRVPSLIHYLFIKEGFLNEISNLMGSIFSNQEKNLNLIWFGSLPMSYYENLEKIVRYNPEYKINLWINNTKMAHTISVINQSTVSKDIFRKITIRSFDREIPFMLKNLTDVSEVNKNTILEAYDLYEKYVSGIYHNYAGASDIARLIILALMPGTYIDIDCTFKSPENWERFKNSLSDFLDKGASYIEDMNAFIHSKQRFEPFIIDSFKLIIDRNLDSKQFNECRYARDTRKRSEKTVKLTGPNILDSNKNQSLGYFAQCTLFSGFFSCTQKVEDPKDTQWRHVPSKGEVRSAEFEDLPERILLSL